MLENSRRHALQLVEWPATHPDPLSDVLSLLKLRSYMSGGFDAGGDWSIEFGEHELTLVIGAP
jgi:hypothetical protein